MEEKEGESKTEVGGRGGLGGGRVGGGGGGRGGGGRRGEGETRTARREAPGQRAR